MWITNFTHKIENWAAESEIVYKLAEGYYQNVIDREVTLANVQSDDHILCIGGGLCPFSGILFHQKTGARVTVIDNNPACIPKAQRVIDYLGLDRYVKIHCQDGADISYDEYSIIHFALQVRPMDYVFSQVEKRAVPGTKLLVRLPKKCLDGMYSRLVGPIAARCPYTTHNKLRSIGSTMLYIKKVYVA